MSSEFCTSSSRKEFDEQPTDLNFAPVHQNLAVGFMNGIIQIFHCSVKASSADNTEEEDDLDETIVKPMRDFQLDSLATYGKQSISSSIRAVLYNESGSNLLAAYSTGSLQFFDTSTSKRVRKLKSAHECEINRIENLTNNTLATGDDSGLIKVWDVRNKDSVGEIKAHLDYITDMVYVMESDVLVTSSGDTSLTVHDMRNLKTKYESHDGFQEEGMSLQPVQNGKKIICGTSSGKVAIFSMESFDKTHAWFSGQCTHQGSIDAMVTLDQKTVITGGADGAIRVLRFNPNRILGVLGRHKEPDSIERLSISHDSSILVSIGVEDCVRLWDIGNLEILSASQHHNKETDSKRVLPELSKRERKKQKKHQRIPNFFTDLEHQGQSK